MTLSGHEDWVTNLAFSPDGNYLATAGREDIVNIWDLSSGLPVTKIEVQSEDGHAGPPGVWAIDFSPDGAWLVIGVNDTIEIWASEGSELLSVLEKDDNERVTAVIFSPDGTRLAASSAKGVVKIWDLENNEEPLNINAHANLVNNMMFSSDGSKLATAAGDTVKYWDASTGERLLRLTGHTDSIYGLALSPDDKHLVSASSDLTMRVWVLDLEELIALGEARVTRSLRAEECKQYLHVDECPAE